MKLFLLAAVAASAHAQTFSASHDLDSAIELAIQQKKIPGAVLIVGHDGKIVHRKAYGHRALVPALEPMTVDTIFDCASLTKVVTTTSAIMKLLDQGKIRIADKVTEYLPEFQNGASEITVRDLMTHFSGLRPDLDLEPEWSGYETGIQRALHDPPAGPPGVKFVYSDINFVLLGEMVRRLSGEPLPVFAKEILYQPLGMKDTMFQPPPSLRPRIAPTEKLKSGEILRGVVHDPTARYMGGIAGHAGMFSTADDLARFCQMMLNKGDLLFSPLTVGKFTSSHSPPTQSVLRGLGWDIDSPLSGNRGELFPVGTSYGHTGFTGTSLWLDPGSNTYVVLLANSVHPARGKSVTSLRGKVATIVAASLGTSVTSAYPPVRTGLDVLVENNFQPFRGKRVGLITNHTGIDREGRRNIDLMLQAGVNLVALYSPEHGILGAEDQLLDVSDTRDAKTGIKVWSLYEGKNRRPTPQMLKGVDVLVFDIADVGARFYTYTTTMAYAMEEAAKLKIPYYVLDRPNPITGTHVEGPVLTPEQVSFVGYFPLPVRHGMTTGELAAMFNTENHIGADLTVVKVQDWLRKEWFDQTNLPWVDPSPNIRNLNAALLYPGIAMLEYSTNYSVGRGTDSPFEVIGAEFIVGRDLARYLNAHAIPGVQVYPLRFKPASSHLAGKTIEGVRFLVVNRETFSAGRLGTELAEALTKLYPGKINLDVNKRLIGNIAWIQAVSKLGDPVAADRMQADALAKFNAVRTRYLLYF